MTNQETAQDRIDEIVEEWFYGSHEDAADALRDLLSAMSDKIEDEEPYATKSIDRLRQVASQIDAEYLEPTHSDEAAA